MEATLNTLDMATGGGSALVKHATIGTGASGANTLLAAVTGKKIRVLSLFLTAAGAVNVYFTSGASTAIFGKSTNPVVLPAAGDQLNLGFNPSGWMETTAGALLGVNLSAAASVAGGFSYIEID